MFEGLANRISRLFSGSVDGEVVRKAELRDRMFEALVAYFSTSYIPIGPFMNIADALSINSPNQTLRVGLLKRR